MANENKKLFKHVFGVLTFVVCLVMIFEADIRNIGHAERDPVGAIALFPKFYLADLGMILPIFLAVLASRAKLPSGAKLPATGKKLLFFVIFCFLYGTAIWLATNNPFQDIGGDFRVFLALIAGLSLVSLLPNKHEILATSIAVASTLAILTGTIILFSMPNTDIMSPFQRATHPSAFSLFGLPLALVGPSIVYAFLIGNRKLAILSWFNAGMFLLTAILIVKTRSLFLAALVGIVLAMITIIGLSFRGKRRTERGRRLKVPWTGLIFCVVFVMVMLYSWSEHYDAFVERLSGLSGFEEDPGIIPRLLEMPTIFESMEMSDHIFGTGLNPPPILIDWEGTPYNTTHIGIMNIWWRFGFPIFLIVVSMFGVLTARWVRNIAYLFLRPAKSKITAATFGLMVCWPGVAAVFFISCMSGGWSPSTMLPLGLLWGIYRVRAESPAFISRAQRRTGSLTFLRIGNRDGECPCS